MHVIIKIMMIIIITIMHTYLIIDTNLSIIRLSVKKKLV